MVSSAPKEQPQENQIADMTDSCISIDDLTPDARNARRRTARSRKLIAESIVEFGPARSGLVDENLNIIAGNGTAAALAAAGITRVRVVEPDKGEWVVVKRDGLTEEQKKRLALIDNRSAELSAWDSEVLLELKNDGFDLSGLFDDDEVSGFTAAGGEPKEYQTDKAEGKIGSLFERFLVPPFTVLDSRQGYWQDRKRAWLALGIEGETGRGENLTLGKSVLPSKYYDIRNEMRRNAGGDDPSWEEIYAEVARRGKMFAWVKGTSIFDPVLCELAYAWFAPRGGKVLDLFAGGSVRGVVAHKLGRQYTGIELRGGQVAANEANWQALSDRTPLTGGESITAASQPRWLVGDSRNAAEIAPGEYDFIFTCPPYADLERYSDDPRDISTMEYGEFLRGFREIVAAGLSLLLPDRFAAIVVGDVRDAKGFYRGLVADTVRAFEDAGARFYNEGILITQAVSLPIRAGKQFVAGRKLGKSHQHLLVFVKGDPKRATQACGPVEIAEFGETGAVEMDEREDSGI